MFTEVNAETLINENAAQVGVMLDKTIPELEDEITDLMNAEAIEVTAFEASAEDIDAQQLKTQPIVPPINTEEPQSKNPLLILLQRSGLHAENSLNPIAMI